MSRTISSTLRVIAPFDPTGTTAMMCLGARIAENINQNSARKASLAQAQSPTVASPVRRPSVRFCNNCREDVLAHGNAQYYYCLQCPGYNVCSKCFPGLCNGEHPAGHLYARASPGGAVIDFVKHGLPHAACDACGTGIFGAMWVCTECKDSLFTFCEQCFSARYRIHPGHTAFTRLYSFQFPNVSGQLYCGGCSQYARGSIWTCEDCPDSASCGNCLPWLRNHHPSHSKFVNCTSMSN